MSIADARCPRRPAGTSSATTAVAASGACASSTAVPPTCGRKRSASARSRPSGRTLRASSTSRPATAASTGWRLRPSSEEGALSLRTDVPRYREQLPQPSRETFLTDGGMETTLIFHQGLDLPYFAAFVLLDDEEGRDQLRSYYRPYVELARKRGVGIVLDTPTWRANADWGKRLGYSAEALADVNRRGVALLEELRSISDDGPPIIISGCIGPRGDGYRVDEKMSAEDAQKYHAPQIATFADTVADLVTA